MLIARVDVSKLSLLRYYEFTHKQVDVIWTCLTLEVNQDFRENSLYILNGVINNGYEINYCLYFI